MNSNDELDGLLNNPDEQPATPTHDVDIDFLRRMFREAASASETYRKNMREDRDFYDGPRQLDDASRAKFRRMRLPETYSNRITSAIGATLGLLDSDMTQPLAVARNEAGDEAASIVTKILRYQSDRARMAEVLDLTSETNLVEGIAAAKIEVGGKGNCILTGLPADQFYYDPHSMRYDFSDANYLIHAYWTDIDATRAKWPDYRDQINGAGFEGTGPEDKPDFAKYWIEGLTRRIMLVDCYYKHPQTRVWMRAIYCHSTILEHGESPFLDDEDRPICAIEGLSYHIMRDGERRGMVRNLVPLQRKINGFEAALHRMAISRGVKASSNAGQAEPVDRETARKEAQRVDPAMPIGWDMLQTDQRYMEMSQAVQIMKQEIDDAAPARAQIAQAGANTSGRARQMLQQSGLAELSRAFGRFRRFEERIYRQMWFRSKQFMTDEQMLRVTDTAGVRQSLKINVPVIEEQMQPVIDPATGQPAIDPNTGQPIMRPTMVQIGTDNEIATMDVDVELQVVQTADSLRDEGKAKLLEYSAKTGISLLDPNFKFAIKFLGLPDEDKIISEYEKCLAEAQQQAAPQQEAQAQQAAQQQAIQATQMQAHAERENAAAERDRTLAAKHQLEVQAAGLDLAYREAMMARGLNPDSKHHD